MNIEHVEKEIPIKAPQESNHNPLDLLTGFKGLPTGDAITQEKSKYLPQIEIACGESITGGPESPSGKRWDKLTDGQRNELLQQIEPISEAVAHGKSITNLIKALPEVEFPMQGAPGEPKVLVKLPPKPSDIKPTEDGDVSIPVTGEDGKKYRMPLEKIASYLYGGVPGATRGCGSLMPMEN